MNFFAALEECRGAITASTTLEMFQPESYTLWEPRNLNVALPWQGTRKFSQFLLDIGYKPSRKYRIPFRWYHLVHRHQEFTREGQQSIYLSEGYDETPLPIILGTSSTAMMNAITRGCMYSFYPGMTSRREVVPNWPGPRRGDKDVYRKRGYKFNSYAPRRSDGMCAQGCALESRRVRGRCGIGVFRWNKLVGEAHPLDEDPIVWQLGEECPYGRCQNRLKVGLANRR